jgi:hypothetical protein
MRVKPEDEEIVRKAAALVNQLYEEYTAKYKASELPPDYVLAFTAVDLAVKYLRSDADHQVDEVQSELEQMASALRQYLNQ